MRNNLLVLAILCSLTLGNRPVVADLITRLDNGMDVVLVENHSVPMIAANIIIKSGGRDESWETWGAAHFLEHLLFNGTSTRTQDEIYTAFDQLGAYHNAHTGSHFTGFMLLCSQDHFLPGFEILTDMIFNSTLPPEKFEKERGIIIEEIARSATMRDNTDQQFRECLFGDEQLARNVLGTVGSISRLARPDVMEFYKTNYVPNNMLLFVTGNFSSDTLLSHLNEIVADFEPHSLPPRTEIQKPDYASLADLGTAYRNTSGKEFKLTIGLDAPRLSDSDFIPFMMLAMLIDRKMSTAFEPGVKASGFSEHDPNLSQYVINISGSPETVNEGQLLEALDRFIEKMSTEPPTAEEIERIARSYRADRVFNAERLHYYGIMYSQYWSLVSWDEFQSWPDRLAQVTPEQITAVAGRWLKTEDRLIVAFQPETVDEQVEEAAVGEGFQKVTTDYGLTLLIRQDPTARVVGTHILVKDRWLWDREYGSGAVDMLHQIIAQTLGDADSPFSSKIEQFAARVKAVDSPYIPYDNYYSVPDYSFIRFEILPEHWKDGVGLIGDLLVNLPITEESVKSAVSSQKRASSSSRRSPASSGVKHLRSRLLPETALSAHIYSEDPVSDPNVLKKLKRGVFHPSNLIISVAGPFDIALVQEEMTAAFAKLARKSKRNDRLEEGESSRAVPPFLSKDNFGTLSIGQAQGAVVQTRILPAVAAEDQAALWVANSWFNNLMGMELREKQGLAYSLGSGLRFKQSGEGIWGLWEITLATRPENLEKAERGINETLEQLFKHEFNEDEVVRLRNKITGRLAMRDMSRIGHAYSMGTGEYFRQNPQYSEELRNSLNGVNAEAVTAVVKKYLLGINAARLIVN